MKTTLRSPLALGLFVLATGCGSESGPPADSRSADAFAGDATDPHPDTLPDEGRDADDGDDGADDTAIGHDTAVDTGSADVEDEIDSCGEGSLLCDGECRPCPSDPSALRFECGADGACTVAQCAFGSRRCDGVCADCPDAPSGTIFGCEAGGCVVSDCPVGMLSCDGACARCTADAHGDNACDGAVCALTCDDAFHECGGHCASEGDAKACGASCVMCPAPAHGTATCVEGACSLTCAHGFHACGDVCAADSDATRCGDTCTACPAVDNGAPVCTANGECAHACDTGYNDCDGRCVAADDVHHCGAACVACPGGDTAFCLDGRCGSACAPGEVACADGCCEVDAGALGAAAIDPKVDDYGWRAIALVDSSDNDYLAVTWDVTGVVQVGRKRSDGWYLETFQAPTTRGLQHAVVDDAGVVTVPVVIDGELALVRFAPGSPATVERIHSAASADTIGAAGIALSPNGIVHLTYYDVTGAAGCTQWYARRGLDGAWKEEVIGSACAQGIVMVDDGGAVHLMVVLDDSTTEHRRRVGASGSWTLVSSLPQLMVGHAALDSLGNLNAVFPGSPYVWGREVAGEWSFEDLPYACGELGLAMAGTTPHVVGGGWMTAPVHCVREGGTWTSTTQLIWGNLGSFAVSSRGEPRIPNFSRWSLQLAVADGNGAQDVVVGGGPQAAVSALAIGPDGALHVAYSKGDEGSPRGLGYATYRAGVWQQRAWIMTPFEYSPGEAPQPMDVAIAVDADGTVAIGAQQGIAGTSIRVLVDGRWVERDLEGAGKTIDLAFGPTGALHVVTVDASGGAREVRLAPPFDALATATLGPGVDVASGVTDLALAIAPDDQAHVAFRRAGSVATLGYATRTGDGPWIVTVVDDGGALFDNVGGQPVMLLDAARRPHIVYVDDTAHDVEHAWRDGATWRREVVMSAGIVGSAMSAAFDGAGVLHVAFGDDAGAAWHAQLGPGGWTRAAVAGRAFEPSGRADMVIDASGPIVSSRSAFFALEVDRLP